MNETHQELAVRSKSPHRHSLLTLRDVQIQVFFALLGSDVFASPDTSFFTSPVVEPDRTEVLAFEKGRG